MKGDKEKPDNYKGFAALSKRFLLRKTNRSWVVGRELRELLNHHKTALSLLYRQNSRFYLGNLPSELSRDPFETPPGIDEFGSLISHKMPANPDKWQAVLQ